MNSKFIESQQTHRIILQQIDLQETFVLRIKRERESHLATALWTYRSMVDYSRIIGEAPMKKMNPSVMVFRLDLEVLELAVAGIVFRRLP